MPNITKIKFLEKITKMYGAPERVSKSYSLFDIKSTSLRLYLRYSKIHSKNNTFYGLRREDLQQLKGKNSIICFLWNDQQEPIFIRYSDFEEIFNSLETASDGQYKIQIYLQEDATELYIANAGRFNIESYYGWDSLEESLDGERFQNLPDFSHFQIQSLVGSIGHAKGYDIWLPISDRKKLDGKYFNNPDIKNNFPSRYEKIFDIVKEIDVIWIKRGSSDIKALFEVEHSTPIYSGLLRFNDLHLIEPNLKPRYNIVSNSIRKSLFIKQISRPTFKMSGLNEICNFLEYKDVFGWFNRIKG